MQVSRVVLNSIRLFGTLDVSFVNESGVPFLWNVVVGDNATGKTTLLRAIAIGLCDESSAAALVRELRGGLVRTGDPQGDIFIELRDRRGDTWTIHTSLEVLKRTGEQVKQSLHRCPISELGTHTEPSSVGTVQSAEFPWHQIFVTGYGPGRSVQGTEEYESYRNVDAVYSLFRYDQPLQSPELSWRRLRDSAANGIDDPQKAALARDAADTEVKDTLRSVLDLGASDSVELGDASVDLIRNGQRQNLVAHADGYRTTATWTLDLLSWRMLFDRPRTLAKIGGIVLLDELEQHLHPRWQRYLVARLAARFPKVQFIAPTHSALCASGVADLKASEGQLVALVREPGGVRASGLQIEPGFTADQVLTSPAFGLPDTRPEVTARPVSRYRALLWKDGLTAKEKQELKRLKAEIEANVPHALQTEEERQVRDDLERLIGEARRIVDEGGGAE